jgi:hypothetical protein
MNPMKVYTKREDLSRATAEDVLELILPVALIVDLRAVPCFIATVAGTDVTAVDAAFAWFVAAQIAACAVAGAVCAVRAIRRARQPKRGGVISAATIRRVLGR